jgi:hypothetical protein
MDMGDDDMDGSMGGARGQYGRDKKKRKGREFDDEDYVMGMRQGGGGARPPQRGVSGGSVGICTLRVFITPQISYWHTYARTPSHDSPPHPPRPSPCRRWTPESSA